MSGKVQVIITGKNLAAPALKSLTKGLDSAADKSTKLNAAMLSLAKIALKGALLTLSTSIATIFKSVQIGSNLEVVISQFETLTKSAKTATDLVSNLRTFAATTPLSFDAVTQGAKTLMAFGVSVTNIQDTMQMLGDVAMGDNEKMLSLSEAFGKVKSHGKASMRELNMFVQNGVPIIQALADTYGTTTAQVLKMVTAGKIGFPEIEAALKSLTKEGGQFNGMMAKQSKTFKGQFQIFKDQIEKSLGDLGLNILPSVESGLTSISTGFQALVTSEGFKNLVTSTVKFISYISDKIPASLIVLEGIGDAFDMVALHIRMGMNNIMAGNANPILEFTFKPIGKMYEALKNGLTNGDWSGVFGASIDLAKELLVIAAGFRIAQSAYSGLLTSMSSGLLATKKFTAAIGVPGALAMITIVVQLMDAMRSGDYEAFAGNMIAGLVSGFAVGGLTLNPKLGFLTFAIIANLGLGSMAETRQMIQDVKDWFYDLKTNTVDMIAQSWNDFADSFLDPINRIKETFGDIKQTFITIGQFITDGILQGLVKIPIIGKWIGNQLDEETRKRLGIASPSKAFRAIGTYIVQGLSLGTSGVELVGKQMGTDLTTGFGSPSLSAAGLDFGSKTLSQDLITIFKRMEKRLEELGVTDYKAVVESILPSEGGKTTEQGAPQKGFFSGFWDSFKDTLSTTQLGTMITGAGVKVGDNKWLTLLNSFGSSLSSSVTSLTSVKAILDPLTTMLSGAMDILEPLIDNILSPLNGSLKILGQLVGNILAPIFEMLATVTELVGDAFVWIYNKILVPIGNGFITAFNELVNGIYFIWNGLASAINWALGWLGVDLPTLSYRSLTAGYLSTINYADLTSAGSSSSSSSGTSSSSSSATSYTIYIYQTVNGNINGEGGKVSFGKDCADAIQSYLGSGGKVKWLEA